MRDKMEQIGILIKATEVLGRTIGTTQQALASAQNIAEGIVDKCEESNEKWIIENIQSDLENLQKHLDKISMLGEMPQRGIQQSCRVLLNTYTNNAKARDERA